MLGRGIDTVYALIFIGIGSALAGIHYALDSIKTKLHRR